MLKSGRMVHTWFRFTAACAPKIIAIYLQVLKQDRKLLHLQWRPRGIIFLRRYQRIIYSVVVMVLMILHGQHRIRVFLIKAIYRRVLKLRYMLMLLCLMCEKLLLLVHVEAAALKRWTEKLLARNLLVVGYCLRIMLNGTWCCLSAYCLK